jgi:hypothetical protein
VGTNFYLHLGKRSDQGEGNPALFTWATDRRMSLLDALGWARIGYVQDEYGREMSFAEFYQLVSGDRSDEHTGMGKPFS